MTKKQLVGIAFIIVLLGVVLLTSVHKKQTSDIKSKKAATAAAATAQANKAPDPTDAEFLASLAVGLATSQNVNSSNTSILSHQQPSAAWCVVHVGAIGVISGDANDPSYAVFHQTSDGTLHYIVGPGTSFASNVMLEDGMPETVQDTLLIYNYE